MRQVEERLDVNFWTMLAAAPTSPSSPQLSSPSSSSPQLSSSPSSSSPSSPQLSSPLLVSEAPISEPTKRGLIDAATTKRSRPDADDAAVSPPPAIARPAIASDADAEAALWRAVPLGAVSRDELRFLV